MRVLKLGGSTETDLKISRMASGRREDDDGERLRLEVEADLMYLNVEGLSVVAQELEIRQGRYVNKGKRIILQEIRSQLDKNEANPDLDSFEGLRFLQTLVRGLLVEPDLCDTAISERQHHRSSRIQSANDPAGRAAESSSESDALSVASGGSGSDAHTSRRQSNHTESLHVPIGRGVGRGIGRGIGFLRSLPPIPRSTLGRGVTAVPLVGGGGTLPRPALGRGTSVSHQLSSVRSAQIPVVHQQPPVLNAFQDRNRFTVSGSDISSIASGSDPMSDVSSVPSPPAVRKRTYRSSTRIVPDSDASSAATSPVRVHHRRSSALHKRPAVTRKSTSVLPSKRISKRSSASKVVNDSVSAADLKEAWRKEFKLKGQIGKVGEKDKLDYLSVKRQINGALKKGYKDSDIIEAVINACSSGTSLKGLLQVLPDMTVDEMLKMLKSYFQEFDGADLLLQLSTAAQNPKDDALTFLIDVLLLKNRIIDEGKHSPDVRFGKGSVMKIMLKTLESGIISERIVNRLRPFLVEATVSDTTLIEEMSKAVRYEKERKAKAKQQSRINAMLAEEEDEKDVKIAALEAQMKELRTTSKEDEKDKKIAKLEAELKVLREANKNKGRKTRIYGCKKCKAEGKGRTCTHCFRCGEGSHKVEACTKPKEEEKSENSSRSSERD